MPAKASASTKKAVRPTKKAGGKSKAKRVAIAGHPVARRPNKRANREEAPVEVATSPAPAAADQQPVEPPAPKPQALPPAAFVVALGSPMLAIFAFMLAHAAVDQPRPDEWTGRTGYLVSLVAGLGGAVLVVLFVHRTVAKGWGWVLSTGLFAGLAGLVLGQSYNDDEGAAMFWLFIGLPTVMVFIIVAAVRAGRRGNQHPPDPDRPVAALIGAGVGVAAGTGLAAAYMLSTFADQAQEARDAYDAPMPAAVLVGLLLLGLSARRRRLDS